MDKRQSLLLAGLHVRFIFMMYGTAGGAGDAADGFIGGVVAGCRGRRLSQKFQLFAVFPEDPGDVSVSRHDPDTGSFALAGGKMLLVQILQTSLRYFSGEFHIVPFVRQGPGVRFWLSPRP